MHRQTITAGAEADLDTDRRARLLRASTISQVGDWLADNAAPFRDALAALFTAPAVLRVLRQADTPLDA